jgi:ABC-2 type transport system permease protein
MTNKRISFLIARQFCRSAFRSNALYAILLVMAVMIGFAAYSGWKIYTTQNAIRQHYQHEVRASWENNPDKHPHRMAHFGSFAFRLKHPLSMFDFGLESFVGNAVYLEAHRQNTVNFSEASFSTGLLRFGEISLAMLLQVVLPLIVFFLGFASVSAERENGTLKIMLAQSVTWKDILMGKVLGIFSLAMVICIPAIVITLLLLTVADQFTVTTDTLLRFAGIVWGYFIFTLVLCAVTVAISAVSTSSKNALMKLLATWLFMIVLLPRTTQALGSYFYPSPSKIEFAAALERDVLKEGDSHNPDDAHYKTLRDSVLQLYKVDLVQQLPFNYSGFVMREGERISAEIYKRHLEHLVFTYKKQNRFSEITAWINPYAAIRNISMALSGTDFESYVAFQQEAEEYRYQLAQAMNELQMKFISNQKLGPDEKPYTISHEHWKELPDFKPKNPGIGVALRHAGTSILALLLWGALSIVFIILLSRKAKAI